MTKDEITDVLTGILTIYYNHQSEGWASADYGLMNDLEDFIFALFSRFNIEDNIWALQEILKMHCMWLTGSYSLTIEPVYNLREEECVTTWSDFWSKL